MNATKAEIYNTTYQDNMYYDESNITNNQKVIKLPKQFCHKKGLNSGESFSNLHLNETWKNYYTNYTYYTNFLRLLILNNPLFSEYYSSFNFINYAETQITQPSSLIDFIRIPSSFITEPDSEITIKTDLPGWNSLAIESYGNSRNKEQIERNKSAILLLQSWLENINEDETKAQAESLELLIKTLDEDRPSNRKLFP